MRVRIGVAAIAAAAVVVPLSGHLVDTAPVAASSGDYKSAVFKMARCDVFARTPYRLTPTDPEAAYEGYLTCDPAILPDGFNNTVCLQAKTGASFADISCCKVPDTDVTSTPDWLMCAQPGRVLPGKYQYRTRARAFRPSTGRGETDYSPAVTFTAPSDNGRIIFTENTNAGGFDIVSVRPDGTGRRRLTFNEAGSAEYDPAGRRIAFVVCRPTCRVWLMKADGSDKRPLIPRESGQPTWSPDGAEIAFVGDTEFGAQLFIYTLATGATRQVTFETAEARTRVAQPTWSPGGKRIAFRRHDVHENPQGDLVADAGALFVMHTDGTRLEQITPVGRWIKVDPDWSPKGGRIAFAQVDPGEDRIPSEAKGIWTIRPDGTDMMRLSRTTDEGPAWAPSGNRLAFVRRGSEAPGDEHPGLWTMGKLGNRPHQIYPWHFILTPDWQPRP